MDVRAAIRNFITDDLLFVDESDRLDDNISLTSSGMLDSTGIIELVTFIESQFGVQVSDEEMLALFAWAPPTVRRRILRHAVEDRPRRPPLTGEDLLELGLAGPAVGRALARIRSAFLDGAVKNREDALALARELGRGRSAGTTRGRHSARTQRGPTPQGPRGGA